MIGEALGLGRAAVALVLVASVVAPVAGARGVARLVSWVTAAITSASDRPPTGARIALRLCDVAVAACRAQPRVAFVEAAMVRMAGRR